MLMGVPAFGYGETEGTDWGKTLSPYFLVEGGDSSFDQFPLKETAVDVNINGTIADIYMTQTYANNGTVPINARYVFPASTRVSVHGMKMQIGDNLIIAKIKEKEEAKQEFEQAKEEGKSASLLEQQRPNVFTMDVANIMPGDTVRIELHYTELIMPDRGICQFVSPTVVGPRYSNKSKADASESDRWVETPYLKDGKTPPGKYDITVNLSTGVPVRDIKCSSHKINIVNQNESAAVISLADENDYAGNRDFILEYRLTGQEVQCGLMLYEGEKENFFMLTIQPPERVRSEIIPGREYIFVLDVSGSMFGYPLDTAKMLIKNLVGHLKGTDTFNIILFSGAFSVMSGSSVPATEANIQKAFRLIDEQEGGGGTELLPALRTAISLPAGSNTSRSIVVITDGYIDGEKEAFDLINENLGKANFFSFGIGESVNRYLIEGIAKAGLGEPFVLTDPKDADEIAGRFREYVQSPVLTDIKVQFDGFKAYDVEPVAVPDLFAQRPIVLFGKWRGRPEGTVRLTGRTGSGAYEQTVQVAGVVPMETNSAISYLWARSRVERLLDYGFGNYDDPDVISEVTDLGLEYSILTPFTSFVAVLEKIRNTEGKSADVDQPLPLPLHVSNLAVGDPYAEGAEPELLILAACALSMALFVFVKQRMKRKAMV
jgi:Ca-activated chloride channel family protein